MQHVCPNCGDPVEQDEIFCDKCGTRIEQDMQGQNPSQIPTPNAYQNQYQTPNPNVYQNQYQIPTPNAYQNQYQTPNTNVNQNQYSYFPGQGQNTQPYTPQPYSVPPQINQYKKPGTGKKILKFVFIVISIIAILIVGLGIISVMTEDKKDVKSTDNSNKPTATDTSKPAANDNTKPAPGKMMASWDGNIFVDTNYNQSEKKIYVDYSLTLKNIGKGNAQNINVYLDPDASNENGKYLGIKPKTIVNYDGIIKQIGAGQQQEIKTQFFYTNIEASSATLEQRKEISNRYLELPILIEWEENGVKFTDKKGTTK